MKNRLFGGFFVSESTEFIVLNSIFEDAFKNIDSTYYRFTFYRL